VKPLPFSSKVYGCAKSLLANATKIRPDALIVLNDWLMGPICFMGMIDEHR
jgi:hypothetical protein